MPKYMYDIWFIVRVAALGIIWREREKEREKGERERDSNLIVN